MMLQMLQQHALPFGLLDLVLTPIVKVRSHNSNGFPLGNTQALAFDENCSDDQAGAAA